jgi:hypothetical protein
MEAVPKDLAKPPKLFTELRGNLESEVQDSVVLKAPTETRLDYRCLNLSESSTSRTFCTNALDVKGF